MDETTLSKLASYHAATVRERRSALVAVGDRLRDRIAEWHADEFLVSEERERLIARARAEAERSIEPIAREAREALEQAQKFARAELGKPEPSERAISRVRRMQDKDQAAGTILKQAIAHGDLETVAALRDELRWGLVHDPAGTFAGRVARALAPLIPGGGEELSGLLDLLEGDAGIREAHVLAARAVAGSDAAAQARIAYAHATGDTGRGDHETGDEGEGNEE